MRVPGCGRKNHGHVWAWCRNPTHYAEEECAWCGKDFQSSGSTPVVFLEDECHYHMGCLVDQLQDEVVSASGDNWQRPDREFGELPEQGRAVKVKLVGEGKGFRLGRQTERGWLVWYPPSKVKRVADGVVEFWAPLK